MVHQCAYNDSLAHQMCPKLFQFIPSRRFFLFLQWWWWSNLQWHTPINKYPHPQAINNVWTRWVELCWGEEPFPRTSFAGAASSACHHSHPPTHHTHGTQDSRAYIIKYCLLASYRPVSYPECIFIRALYIIIKRRLSPKTWHRKSRRITRRTVPTAANHKFSFLITILLVIHASQAYCPCLPAADADAAAGLLCTRHS